MREAFRALFAEKYLHLAFELGLWLKGAFAVTEIIGGVLAYFVTQQFLIDVASAITRGEIAENPRDFVANYLLQSVQSLSVSTQNFMSFYLLGHGVIKLWLIVGLLRAKLWYYPTGIIVFGLFILYQLYRFDSTHSLWLLLITAVDVVVIGLTWHEYWYICRHLRNKINRS